MKTTCKMILKWLAALLVLVCAGTAAAVTTVSTNTAAGSWNDASRWSAGVPTQPNDAVLAASVNNVTTRFSNYTASARSLGLSNANVNSSVQLQPGGSLKLYGDAQVAGRGSISGGDGSLLVSQTNAAVAGLVLNAASVNCQSLTISASASTAVFTINSNQSFTAVNCVVGNIANGVGNGSAGELKIILYNNYLATAGAQAFETVLKYERDCRTYSIPWSNFRSPKFPGQSPNRFDTLWIEGVRPDCTPVTISSIRFADKSPEASKASEKDSVK